MSHRSAHRLLLRLSLGCVVILLPACAEVRTDVGAPGGAIAAPDSRGVFAIESPSAIVAAEGQAWALTHTGDVQSLSRIEKTGPPTLVMRVPGQGAQTAPYRDGVVVASVACADNACRESIVNSIVVDGRGSTVSTQQFARKAGPPDRGDAFKLIGVHEDLVWLATSQGLVAFDAQTGQTAVQAPSAAGVTCLLADGELYALLSLREQLGSRTVYTSDTADVPYEVAIHRLVGAQWTLLPETRRSLTERQLGLTKCVGGVVRSGPDDSTSPAWSPTAGWTDGEPFLRREGGERQSEGGPGGAYLRPLAIGRENQQIVLDSDGVLRRVFGSPGSQTRVETLNVPADIFRFDGNGPPPRFIFDKSSTVMAGCIEQPSAQGATAKCYIGTP